MIYRSISSRETPQVSRVSSIPCSSYHLALSNVHSAHCKTCPELISTLSNSSSSARSTSSASVGWSSEHKSVGFPRRMIASKRWRSASVVKPHHALQTTCSDAFATMHLPCRALTETEEHDRSAQMICLCCIHVLPQRAHSNIVGLKA